MAILGTNSYSVSPPRFMPGAPVKIPGDPQDYIVHAYTYEPGYNAYIYDLRDRHGNHKMRFVDTNNQLQPAGPQAPAKPKFRKGDIVLYPAADRTTEWQVMSRSGSVYEIVPINSDEYGPQRANEQELRLIRKGAAPRKKPVITFDSVIIPDEKRQQILEALEQIHQSELIFTKWGFDSTIEKGRGLGLLFYGEPGTGKTLMGQAIAHKMKRELKIISTADIQSSAPGEAERNIRKHFKDATEKNYILLFDECDSMIYTRENVGAIMAAHVNELLSQLERFNGVTIFTTNRLGQLDEAVNRRLALKLEFPMPTAEERVQIWRRMFPKKAPLAKDIDWELLASIEISGGYIKNAVLRAARMAAIEKCADKDKKITMAHLKKALKLETESMIDFADARKIESSGVGHVMADNHRIVKGRA